MSNEITENGHLSFRQLQEENNNHQLLGSAGSSLDPGLLESIKQSARNLGEHSAYNIKDTAPYYEDSDVKQTDFRDNKHWWQSDTSDYFGNSMWDNPEEVSYGEHLPVADRRANNQWSLAKLGAGLAKAVGLAGSTFVNGTAGLMFGTVKTIGAIGDENQSWAQTFSHIFNNEVTNGISQFNESMETWLPNYKTQEEKDSSWIHNVDTVNFWADSIIKNVGFTIGAVYSGKALTSVLDKAIKIGPVGVKLAGSLFGAVSEATFEANNLYNEFTEAQYKKAAEHFGLPVEAIKEMDEFADLRNDIDERASRAGLFDLVTNVALLTAGDYAVFGKLFTKGFSAVEKDLAKSDVAKRISQKAYDTAKGLIGKYDAKIKGTKGAVAKTAGDMLTEGNEELAQSFLSSMSGAMYDIDSPDTYYKIKRDKSYQVQANDLLSAMTKGVAESYGDFDRWEEFVAGSMTALLGVPTFGKQANSSSDTWLGNSKPVGMTGGLFGNIASTKEVDQEASQGVESLNNIIDKLNQQSHFFAHNMSYTDKMDRYRAEGNKFEYKNNEDNSDFEAIDIFSQFNRLDDLKRIVDQDIDSLKDSDVVAIVSGNTQLDKSGTVVRGGWQNKAGQPLLKKDGNGNAYISDEDKQFVKDELKKKQETLKQKIDDYEQSKMEINLYPASAMLKNDDKKELTWLKWKKKQFDNRIYDMAMEGKDSFQKIASWLSDGIEEAQKELDDINRTLNAVVSTTDEEGNKTKHYTKREKKLEEKLKPLNDSIDHGKKMLNILNAFIDATSQKGRSKELIASKLERLRDKNRFMDDIIHNEKRNKYDALAIDKIDGSVWTKSYYLSSDIDRALKLRADFLKKFNDYIANPERVKDQRDKAEKKEKKDAGNVNEAVNAENKKHDIKDKSVSEIVESSLSDNTVKKDLEGMINDPSLSEEDKQKVKSALEIQDAYNKAMSILKDKLDKKEITQSKYAIVANILKNNANNANSLEEFKKTDTYAALNSFDGLSKADSEAIQNEINETGQDPESYAQDVAMASQDLIREIFDNISDYNSVSTEEQKRTLEGDTHKVKIGDTPSTPTANDIQKRKKKEDEKNEQDKAKENKRNELVAQWSELVTKTAFTDEALQDADFKQAITGLVSDFLRSAFLVVEKNPGVNPEKYDSANSAIKELNAYKNIKEQGEAIPAEAYRVYKNGDRCDLETLLTVLRRTVVAYATEYKEENSSSQNTTEENPSISEEEAKSKEVPMADEQPANSYNDTPSKKQEISHKYWRTTTNEVPNFFKGDTDLAKTLRKAGYKDEIVDRIMIIHKFLKSQEAFINAFNLKKDEEIFFGTDHTLNQGLAGEGNPIQDKDIVILMYDSYGNVVGDLTLPELSSFTTQVGLPAFREQFLKEYRAHEGETYVSQVLKTTVSQKLVGEIPYSAKSERHTLQEIFTQKDSKGNEKQVDFNIAVMSSQGFLCGDDSNIDPSDIMMPLNYKNGWVYVLYPTGCDESGRKWFPVPIIMKRFDSDTIGTTKGKTVKTIFEELKNSTSITHKSLMKVKNRLQKTLYLPEVHINYNNGILQLTVKQRGNLHQAELYKGRLEDLDIDSVISQLYGTPFQVDTENLNSKNIRKENIAISEVSSCNLIPGQVIPFGSWFTLNPILFGEQTTADRLESIQYNPKAVSSGNTYTATVTYKKSGTQVYTLNLDDNSVVKQNQTLELKNMTKNDRLTCAKMWTEAHNILQGTTETPFGEYDVDNHKFLNEAEESDNNHQEYEDLGDEDEFDIDDYNTMKGELNAGNAAWFGGTSSNTQQQGSTQQQQPQQEVTASQSGTQEDNTDNTTQTISSENETDSLRKALNELGANNLGDGSFELNGRLSKYRDLIEASQYQSEIKKLPIDYQRELASYLQQGFDLESALKEVCGFNRDIDNSIKYEPIDIEREKKWLKNVLPQFSEDEHLRIINAAQENSKKNITYWGKFKNGIITIANDAAKGTLFHEAFHAVSQSLLSKNERDFMYKEAAKVYGKTSDILLEEHLAESFRKYVQIEETPIVGSVVKLFRSLKHIILNLVDAEPYLDNLYYRICRCDYSSDNNRLARNYRSAVKMSDKKAKEIAKQIKKEEHEFILANKENKEWYNLSSDTIEYLKDRGISRKEWSKLSSDIKEKMLLCKP